MKRRHLEQITISQFLSSIILLAKEVSVNLNLNLNMSINGYNFEAANKKTKK